MVYVSKKKGDTKDTIFRKFSRMFMDEQIVDKLREIQFYKKPSRRRLEKIRDRARGVHVRSGSGSGSRKA